MMKISFRVLSAVVLIVMFVGIAVPPVFSDAAISVVDSEGQTNPLPQATHPTASPVLNALQTPEQPFEPSFVYRSAVLNQLGRGFSNVLYAAFEIPYRIKNEIQDVDPVRGLIPGTIKGVSWCVARAAIGVFEMLSFYAPHKQPYIEDFDTDWIYA